MALCILIIPFAYGMTITRDLPTSATVGKSFTVDLVIAGTSDTDFYNLYENVNGYTITSVTSGYNCDYQANPDYLSCYVTEGAADTTISYTATSDNPTGITFSGKYLPDYTTTPINIGGDKTISDGNGNGNGDDDDNNTMLWVIGGGIGVLLLFVMFNKK